MLFYPKIAQNIACEIDGTTSRDSLTEVVKKDRIHNSIMSLSQYHTNRQEYARDAL